MRDTGRALSVGLVLFGLVAASRWAWAGSVQQDGPTALLTQEEKELLQGDDQDKTLAWLDSKWQAWATTPSLRSEAEKSKLIAVGRLAIARKERSVRMHGLRVLAGVAPAEATAAALKEFRDALSEDDRASVEALRPIIMNLLRSGHIPVGKEIALGEQYGREMFEMAWASGARDSLGDLDSAVVAKWVAEGMESRERADYRRAQGGLMFMAERGAPQADALIERAAKSELKVSIRGNPEFYPLRETAAVAARIVLVVRARDSAKAVQEEMASLQPKNRGSDEVAFLWCLNYVVTQKMTSAIPFLEGLLSRESLLSFREQVGDAIRSLRQVEKGKAAATR